MAKENNKQPKKQDSDALKQKKDERARAARRRNRQLIGLALTILVVVGAVSIVMAGVNLVRNMLDSSTERDEYKALFEPMVWFDFLPFDSVTQVDENSIKQVCIWGALNTKPDAEVERDEYGQPLLPAIEIDQYAISIFGPDFRFSGHQSFVDREWDLTYEYNDATQMYTVPSTGLEARYLATVVEIKRESGGVRRVVMGYVSTRTSDNQVVQQPDYEHPNKFMDFMLRRDGNRYYLYAIQANTTHEVTAPPQTESIPEMLQLPEDYSVPDYVPDVSVPPEPPVSSEVSLPPSSEVQPEDTPPDDTGEDDATDDDTQAA